MMGGKNGTKAVREAMAIGDDRLEGNWIAGRNAWVWTAGASLTASQRGRAFGRVAPEVCNNVGSVALGEIAASGDKDGRTGGALGPRKSVGGLGTEDAWPSAVLSPNRSESKIRPLPKLRAKWRTDSIDMRSCRRRRSRDGARKLAQPCTSAFLGTRFYFRRWV